MRDGERQADLRTPAASHRLRAGLTVTSVFLIETGWILSAGCGKPPIEVTQESYQAFAEGRADKLLPLVHGAYLDALGDRSKLLADMKSFQERFPRISLSAQDLSVSATEGSDRVVVVGRLDGEFVGDPQTWQVTGPTNIELRREDGFRVISGLLSDLRDIVALMDRRRAAIEANDLASLEATLHPAYRDGDLDRAAVIERLKHDLGSTPVRMSTPHYRLELRGPLAHVDEYYTLSIRQHTLPPAIGRLTLGRSAGRWLIQAGLYANTNFGSSTHSSSDASNPSSDADVNAGSSSSSEASDPSSGADVSAGSSSSSSSGSDSPRNGPRGAHP